MDNDLQILKYDRSESGKKDIIMANFQAHPHRDSGVAVVPYEMFDTNGMYIKENSPFQMTFVATCANGGYGYFPSLVACKNGGYEPDTGKYEHGSAEILADLYVQMLKDLKG